MTARVPGPAEVTPLTIFLAPVGLLAHLALRAAPWRAPVPV